MKAADVHILNGRFKSSRCVQSHTHFGLFKPPFKNLQYAHFPFEWVYHRQGRGTSQQCEKNGTKWKTSATGVDTQHAKLIL